MAGVVVDGERASPSLRRAERAAAGEASSAAGDDDGGVPAAASEGAAAGPAWALYAPALLPFLVAAVAAVVTVGGDYMPAGDLAMTEMHVRDVGRHEVLTGLFSRWDWNHPGPLQFYLVAPFYWLTGGSSVGTVLGALAINGASVAGMVAVARRRGGTPAALCTVLVAGLLVRTLGPEFLGDDWNITITALPFGLLVVLTWGALRGDVWMLPVAAFVTCFLVQTHVAFGLIATPLLALAAGALAWPALRERREGRDGQDRQDRQDGRGRDRRPWLVAAAVLVVTWVPPVVDVVVHAPSNLGDLYRYFSDPFEPSHSLGTGWEVVMGQFGPKPEWLTGKLPYNPLSGESPFVGNSPAPVWLPLVAVAAVSLWRRSPEGRALVVTLGAVVLICIVSIARTLGPVADYRVRYTWIPPAAAAVVVLWAGWQEVSRRWPRAESRLLVPGATLAAALLGAVNVFSAATAGTPHEDDADVVRTISAPVVAAYGDADEPLVVWEPLGAAGPWYSRGLVLQLERHGIPVKVDRRIAHWFSRSRTHDGGPVADRLVVATDDHIDALRRDGDLRPIARWTSIPDDERRRVESAIADLEAARDAGEIAPAVAGFRILDLSRRLASVDGVTAHEVVVFVDEGTR